jgi:hypothetical protein
MRLEKKIRDSALAEIVVDAILAHFQSDEYYDDYVLSLDIDSEFYDEDCAAWTSASIDIQKRVKYVKRTRECSDRSWLWVYVYRDRVEIMDTDETDLFEIKLIGDAGDPAFDPAIVVDPIIKAIETNLWRIK